MWEAVPPHHEEGEPGWEGTSHPWRQVGCCTAAWAALPSPAVEQARPRACCPACAWAGCAQLCTGTHRAAGILGQAYAPDLPLWLLCDCPALTPQCLQSLCDLRLSPHFPYTAEVDQAVGAAVSAMGPEVLLEAVPLQIDGKE